jgi:hypothetical protein
MPGDLAIDLNSDGVYEFGVVGYGLDKGDVYFGPDWSLPHGDVGYPGDGPSTLSGGTYLDTIPFIYADVGSPEPGNSHTYILEMSLPLALLGDPEGHARLHHTMTCGNDPLDGEVGIGQVPEPATLGLAILGAMLTLGCRRRYH